MSLDYYRLRPPVTSLRVETSGVHTRLSIWVNHALSGILTLREEELGDFALSFVGCGQGVCLHTYFGGQEEGLIVDSYGGALPDGTVVISAHGGIATVGEIMALAGAGRKEKSNAFG